MARLNISVPGSLYERLDRLRDRLNVSKVCAAALAKELDILEGHTTATSEKVGRLVERLQSQQSDRDRWYQRGRQDGETWALETATLNELDLLDRLWRRFDRIPPAHLEELEAREHWTAMLPTSFEVGRSTLAEEPLASEPQLAVAYLVGWYQATNELWQETKPHLG